MREFVKKHNQLQHTRGVTYRVKYDKWHGHGIEISISRDIMAEMKWNVTKTLVDLEWDRCRMYIVHRPDGMYKVRFSHTSYECHPQRDVAGRFVGCIKCAWKQEMGLPKIETRTFCSDIKIGKSTLSFAMPR